MPDPTPFLTREGNQNVDNNRDGGPINELPANPVHSEMFRKRLTTTALVLSTYGVILFLASFIIIREAPFTPWWNWDAGRVNIPLSILMLLSAIFCIVNLCFKIPALLACIIQAILIAFIVPCLKSAFHDSRFPSSKWCRVTYGPIGGGQTGTIYPPRHCKDWKLALSIVMGIAIGFAIIICIIYIGDLLHRTYKLVFGTAWKGRNMLTFDIPSGTFKFEVSIGFIRQEPVQHGVGEGEGTSSTAHGPVYI